MSLQAAKIPIRQTLWQIPLLAAMACLIALTVNRWRDAPLPLVGDWSVAARLADHDGDTLEIPLEEARQLFDRKGAKFLDARPRPQYRRGHISGALNLPWQDVTDAFTDIAAQLADGDTIITYCDGDSCRLSHDLAMFLRDMGYADVRVLVNGWTVWQDTGLPTENAGEADE